MSLTTPTKLPSIPRVTKDSAERALRSAAEVIKVWKGEGGDQLDQVATFRDLFKLGVVSVRGGDGRAIGIPTPIGSGPALPPLPSAPAPEDDLTIPPAPAGLSANGALANIILDWNPPNYSRPRHAFTEIWRAAVDDLGQAVRIGTAPGSVYADNVGDTNVTRYYWIRFVSTANIAGPFNAVSGTVATTGFVLGAHLKDLAVTATKIADGSIDLGGTKITGLLQNLNLAVISDPTKIADSLIGNTKLADLAVTAAKIAATIGGGNLVANSSFERPDNAITPWYVTGDHESTRVDSWSQSYHGGKVGVVIVDSLGGAGQLHNYAFRQDITSIYDGVITLRVAMRTGAPSARTGGVRIIRYIGGVPQYEDPNHDVEVTSGINPGEWILVTATVPSAAGANVTGYHVRAGYEINGTAVAVNDELYLDAAKLERGDVPTTFAVKEDEILPATIGATEIAAAAVGTAAIQTAAITTALIANLAVGSAQIAAAAITAAKIGSAAVGSAAIANLAVQTAHLEDAAVTNAKIGNLAVDAAQIAAGAIVTAKIGDLQVTGAKIADATIGTAKIIAAAITTALIGDLQVTNAKIASAAITNAKIGNAAVDTLQLAGQAVTIPVSAFSTDLTTTFDNTDSGNELTLQQASLTSTGNPVHIFLSWMTAGGMVAGASEPPSVANMSVLQWRVYRDSTSIYDSGKVGVGQKVESSTTHESHQSWSLSLRDTPSAGSHTYYLKAFAQSVSGLGIGGGKIYFESRSLVLLEVKR